MNYVKACNILGISSEDSIDIIKKKYRALILKNHPDKLTGVSNERFIQIHEAYHYILSSGESEPTYDAASDAASVESDEPEEKMDMRNIFLLFWKNPAVYTLLTNVLISIWENNLPVFLKKLDTTNLKKIHQTITKYFPDNQSGTFILKSIEKVLEEKTESLIILNPNLDDLLDSNIYKLKMDGETYLVPLWHNELVYAGGTGCAGDECDDVSKEIIIQCCPLLAQNMEIDDNILTVYLSIHVREAFNNPHVDVRLTDKHTIEFDGRQLKMTADAQRIVVSGDGIAAINEKSIYDIGIKKDIVLVIYLVLDK